MSEKSIYYNLSIPADWNPEEFRFVVQTLESLPLAKLLSLLDRFGITFTEGNSAVNDAETLIAALIDDTDHDELVRVLKKTPNDVKDTI